MTGRGTAAAIGGALAVAVACGGGQTPVELFSTDWADDGGVSIGRVWQRVGSGPHPAVRRRGGGRRRATPTSSSARRSGGGAKWTFAHPLDARPVSPGNVVVGSGGDEVFALDAKTGVAPLAPADRRHPAARRGRRRHGRPS